MPPSEYAPRPATIKWLLDSDPAIRWQVLRDLTDAPSEAIAAERAHIATKGWGAQLLAQQSRNGKFGGARENAGLMTTFNSLVVLKDLGLDPASLQAKKAVHRIDKHLRFSGHRNHPFFHGETEPCINGRILGLGAYFQKPNATLLQQLLSEQLPDGGWNCEAVEESPKRPKSKVSSFHTTLCVLEGLLGYERAAKKSPALTKARKRAEEYLLERHLFRSKRTNQIIDPRWLRFSYPPFWHYDVLHALDYFRNAATLPNAPAAGTPHSLAAAKPDPRLREAIEVVLQRRHQNGRWPLNHLHREQIPIKMETAVASASRWNTLRALRVLRWYFP